MSPRALSVFHGERLVGTLLRTEGGGLCFAYAASWLRSESSSSISLRLPLVDRTFFVEADGFFPNLLPEGNVRALLARRLGLSKVGRHRLCVVKRFDRQLEGDQVVRSHQEDLCQALALPPSRKYEKEGGPSFADCYALVTGASRQPMVDGRALLRWCAFKRHRAQCRWRRKEHLSAPSRRRLRLGSGLRPRLHARLPLAG